MRSNAIFAWLGEQGRYMPTHRLTYAEQPEGHVLDTQYKAVSARMSTNHGAHNAQVELLHLLDSGVG